jgi:hypothetical protein
MRVTRYEMRALNPGSRIPNRETRIPYLESRTLGLAFATQQSHDGEERRAVLLRVCGLFSFAEYPVACYGDEGGENPP